MSELIPIGIHKNPKDKGNGNGLPWTTVNFEFTGSKLFNFSQAVTKIILVKVDNIPLNGAEGAPLQYRLNSPFQLEILDEMIVGEDFWVSVTFNYGKVDADDPVISIPTFDSIYKGAIVPASPAPGGSGVATWSATQAGTYTNFGGVVVNANSLATISRNAAGVFAISQTTLDLSSITINTNIPFYLADLSPSTGIITLNPASAWKTTKLTSLIDIDRIEYYVRTYNSGQPQLRYYKKIDEDNYTFLSSTYVTVATVVNKISFPTDATHFTLQGIDALTGSSFYCRTYALTSTSLVTEVIKTEKNYIDEKKKFDEFYVLDNIVDRAQIKINSNFENATGRIITQAGSTYNVTGFCKIVPNIEYTCNTNVNSLRMYDRYYNYLGIQTTTTQTTFTVTNSNCYYIRSLHASIFVSICPTTILNKNSLGLVFEDYTGVKKIKPSSIQKRGVQGIGDSLIGRGNCFVRLSEVTGRPAFYLTYGGMDSSFIRERFVDNINRNYLFNIIWVGQNNYGETQTIIEDIAYMVSLLNHRRFLVVGCWIGAENTIELQNIAVGKLITLENRLESIYSDRYLNLRKSVINGGYDMGAVKLTAPFTQPVLDNVTTVNIYVDNIPFLIYVNSFDSSKTWVKNQLNLMIGINDVYDTYLITNSTIVSGNAGYVTCKLLTQNRITPGNVVNNLSLSGTPAGTSTPIAYTKFLKVFKESDKIVMDNGGIPPTFREDGIHQNTYGGKCVGELIAAKVFTLNN